METKPWYLSKTIIGSLITAVVGVLALLGYVMPGDSAGFLTDQAVIAVEAVAGLVGVGLAVYGRFKAKTKIK